jgi:uncharacterized membrane protein
LLQLARGDSVELVDAFRPGRDLLKATMLVVLLSVASSIGFTLCVLPGLALMVLSFTAFAALADRHLHPAAAIVECINHSQRHFLSLLYFGVLCGVIILVGSAFCFVGAIVVSVPLVVLAQVYVYLRLNGETPFGAQ